MEKKTNFKRSSLLLSLFKLSHNSQQKTFYFQISTAKREKRSPYFHIQMCNVKIRPRLCFAKSYIALWTITAKNTDWSTGPLARPFARSLAPLTHSLAPDCSLCLRPPLRSLVCSLAHFAHSLARGKVNF